MQKILHLHRALSRFDAPLALWGGALMSLLLRGYIGWQFFKAGLVKIGDWSATLSLFRHEYHTPVLPPEVAAVMGAMGELVLPVLLLVGLFSRPAALGLFVVNATAVISYPLLLTFDCPAAINDHFYWGVLLMLLVVLGPGRASIDAWLAEQAKK